MKLLKPFDILQERKGEEILVSLKNGEVYRGKLKSFDIHLNLVLFEATSIEDKKETEAGNLLIRGDTIVTIKNL